jgi:anti-sigma factor RsiW
MNCQRVIRSLSACQDGELDPALRREVEGHLENCRACRAEWESLQDLVGRMRLSPPPALDPFFSARVMAALRPGTAKPFRLLPAAAYAMVFAVVFLAGFLLQTSGSGQAPAEPPAAATYSAVLLEPQELGLLAVHEDTLELFNGSDHGQK